MIEDNADVRTGRSTRRRRRRLTGAVVASLLLAAGWGSLGGFGRAHATGTCDTWTGRGTTSNWTDAGNWDNGVAPTSSDAVCIPATTGGFSVDVTAAAAASSVTIGDAISSPNDQPFVVIHDGASLTATSAVTDYGSLSLATATASLSATGVTVAAGGLLSGQGTVTGPVDNGGTLDLFTAPLTITGNYTQEPSGTLWTHVNSAQAGAAWGSVHVSGTATLGGTLFTDAGSVSFTPNVGDQYQFVTANSFGGAFSQLEAPTYTYPTTGATYRFAPHYSTTTFFDQVVPTATNLITDGELSSAVYPSTVPAAGGYTELTAGTSNANTLTGWTVTTGSVDWMNGQLNGPSPAEPFSVDMNGSGPGTLEQTGITTTNGHTYSLSFELSGNPACGPGPYSLGVKWNGATVGTYQTNPTWGWSSAPYVRPTVTVTGTGSDTLDFVSLSAGNCGPVIGDVSLVAAASVWDLAHDFPVSTDGSTAPANPGPDAYGNPAVWEVGYGATGTYSTLPTPSYSGPLSSYTPAPSGDWHNNLILGNDPGVEGWQYQTATGTAYAGNTTSFPFMGQNTTTSTYSLWPAGAVFAHPDSDRNQFNRPTVAWTSPVTGAVTVDARISRLDCNGGTGIDFSVDRLSNSNMTSLGSDMGTGMVSSCPGTGTFDQTVNVSRGDVLYFSSGDGGAGDFSYDTTQFQVTISSLVAMAPPDPAITASGTTINATEGQALPSTTHVASFTDPDTSAASTDYTATIDWGDGTTSAGAVGSGGLAGSFVVTGGHTYAEEGSDTVTVHIADATNAVNHAAPTTSVTVADAALTGSGVGTINSSSSFFNGTVATFTDAYTSAPATDYSATIAWGDNSTSAGTIAPGPNNGSYTVSGSHTYASAGSYKVVVAISDVGGAITNAATNPTTISISVPAVPAPAVNPTSLSWGKGRRVPAEQALTVTNSGTATGNAAITAIQNSGSGVFSLDLARSTCTTATSLVPGGSCVIYEMFTAAGRAPKGGWNGTLTVGVQGVPSLTVSMHAV